ncbi:MAG: alpha-glucosidase [Myxococcales bacterium]|nr:alpha-glucosidase [Myxococcales bacterium]|tara:strand:- start:187 stop:1809 length:1623 start_codon:yes stop_codon:yes gene_type:complete
MHATEIQWWRKGILYQVYPRSFFDASERGWGDLKGVRQKLPYLASLGVDAVWISPIFKSPMKDFGYDVEDHRMIDPMFGTEADFDGLIADAKQLNLKIMVDLVLSHVADVHPWFQDATRSRESEYSNCFVWAEPRADGGPPNNWLSIFGGSAWSWSPERHQYYLHNFLKSQPDLNFHEPRVRAEALSIARFWLERGVSGFRLDTVNFYFHDEQLRDNPPSETVGNAVVPDTNPYSKQDHIYDKNRPEVRTFLSELGALTEQYSGTVTLGEVGAIEKRSWPLIQEYTQPKRLSLCYSFDLLSEIFNADRLRSVINRSIQEAPDTWPCWAFSNHDVGRSASRLAPDGVPTEPIARLAMSLLLSLRGTPCVYQGEELGLEEAHIPYNQLQDPYGIEFWPDYVGRDGCRTPMPWDGSEVSAGFTSHPKPWLPIPAEHRARAVNIQDDFPNSMLNYFRRLVGMRKAEECLHMGDFTMLEGAPDILAFVRSFEAKSIQCHYNLSSDPAVLSSPPLQESQIFDGTHRTWRDAPTLITLGAWEWVWLR